MSSQASLKLLSMFIHLTLHTRLKTVAAKRGVSVTELVTRLILEGLGDEG